MDLLQRCDILDGRQIRWAVNAADPERIERGANNCGKEIHVANSKE